MSLARSLVICVVLAGFIGSASADEKISVDKLIGSWKVSKAESVPPDSEIEFTKDGKFKFSAKMGDQTVAFEGTYKVDGNKLIVTLPDSKGETMTIKKLTDTEFVTLDDKGKTDEFSKIVKK